MKVVKKNGAQFILHIFILVLLFMMLYPLAMALWNAFKSDLAYDSSRWYPTIPLRIKNVQVAATAAATTKATTKITKEGETTAATKAATANNDVTPATGEKNTIVIVLTVASLAALAIIVAGKNKVFTK